LRTRERWLHDGLEILAESGFRGLATDSVCTRLGLSKGSFYHHFDGMSDCRRALLSYVEERESRDFIERANAAPGAAGERRLRVHGGRCPGRRGRTTSPGERGPQLGLE
jgi:AcrR family transcriptional regulator